MTTSLLTTQVMPYDLMERSFAAAITHLMPMGGAPLLGLTSMLRDKKLTSFSHQYFTKLMAFPQVKINNGTNVTVSGDSLTFNVVASDTSVAGDLNANNIVVNDLLTDIETYELFHVTAINVNDLGVGTITVRRSVGKNSNLMTDANTGRSIAGGAYPKVSGYTTPSAAASGIPAATGNTTRAITLYHAGNAFPEASTRPTAVALIADFVTTYTHIVRNSWAVSGTNAVMRHVAGNGPIAENKQDCGAFHALAIERALFWSQKSLTNVSGNLIHTTDGIINVIRNNASNNITALGADGAGSTSWSSLEAALDKTLQVKAGPTEGNIRQVFCGGDVIRGVTDIARKNSDVNIMGDQGLMTQWGLEVRTVKTARGKFEFIEHPLFNVYGSNTSLSKTAVIADLDHLDVAYLRPTKEDNYNQDGARVDNGIDAQGGTLTTEFALEMRNPAAFGLLTNFGRTGAVG